MAKNDKTGAFAEFLSLTDDIAKDSSYTAKTQLVSNFIKKFVYVLIPCYHLHGNDTTKYLPTFFTLHHHTNTLPPLPPLPPPTHHTHLPQPHTHKSHLTSHIFFTYLNNTSGDIYLLCKLLLCKEDKRVYNIKDKSLCKLLSRYFR